MRAVRFVGVGHPAQITDVALRLRHEHSLLGISGRVDGGDCDGPRWMNPRGNPDFPLEQAVDVYDKLKAGQITGRAVLIPDGA